MIQFVVPREHEFGIRRYIERWAPALGEHLAVLHYEDLRERASVPVGTYIFSALDQLTAAGTRLVTELQTQLDACQGARVLNRPGIALLRFELLEELHRQGLNRHRAFRASSRLEELRFPVFLREEFRHTGSLTPLLHNRAELERALGRAFLQGYRFKELLVVEFCDTVDAAGRYRKYAAFVVGSEVIPRSLGIGRGWMLKHEEVEFSEALALEERAYMLANPHERQLRRIFDLAGIEYGRIDYAMKEGSVETWEINLNPTVGPGDRSFVPPELQAVRQPARDEFNRRFLGAMKAVDVPQSLQSVPVPYSTGPVVRPPAREGPLAPLARAMRPIRPWLDPAVSLVAPLVARAARRFR